MSRIPSEYLAFTTVHAPDHKGAAADTVAPITDRPATPVDPGLSSLRTIFSSNLHISPPRRQPSVTGTPNTLNDCAESRLKPNAPPPPPWLRSSPAPEDYVVQHHAPQPGCLYAQDLLPSSTYRVSDNIATLVARSGAMQEELQGAREAHRADSRPVGDVEVEPRT